MHRPAATESTNPISEEVTEVWIGPVGPIRVTGAELQRLTSVRRAARAINGLNDWPGLAEALGTGSLELRWRAANKLAAVCDSTDGEAVGALIGALGDEAREVRAATAHALARLHRDDVRDALAEAVDDEDAEVRWQATLSLAALRDRRCLRPLVYNLKFGRATRRARAADVLGALGDRRAIPSLMAARDDGHDAVRAAAQAALTRFGVDD